MDFDWMESALMFLQIILLDIALGGDNSIIIGMAARSLPHKQQKKVVLFGTAGAILARIALAVVLVWLLAIPYLKTAGGLVLVYIGMKLIAHQGAEEDVEVKEQTSFWGAVYIVIAADVIMSLDNVLAIVAATNGNILMLAIGLLISVPIIILGSTIVIKIMDRFPWIVFIGALVIGWAAGSMLATDTHLGLGAHYELPLKIGMTAFVGIGGYIWQKLCQKKGEKSDAKTEGKGEIE